MLLFPAPLCMALHKEPRLLVLHPHFGPFRTSAVVMSTVTASSEGLTSLLPLPLQSNALSRNGGFSHASCSDGCDAKAGFWASVPPATAGQRLCVCDPSEWHGARCRSPVAFTAEPQVTQATWPRGCADGSLIAPALIEKKSESSQHAGPLRVLEGLRGGMGGGGTSRHSECMGWHLNRLWAGVGLARKAPWGGGGGVTEGLRWMGPPEGVSQSNHPALSGEKTEAKSSAEEEEKKKPNCG